MKIWTSICALALGLGALVPPLLAQQTSTRIYAVKVAVSDFERSTLFYKQLGMVPGVHFNAYERELKPDSAAGGSSIIMVSKELAVRAHVTLGGTTLLISTPDVPAALARLRAAGFPVSGEPRVSSRSTIIMIQDPDGNWIEIAGPGSGASEGKGG